MSTAFVPLANGGTVPIVETRCGHASSSGCGWTRCCVGPVEGTTKDWLAREYLDHVTERHDGRMGQRGGARESLEGLLGLLGLFGVNKP